MRNMTKGLRVAVLLVVLALVATACGSDDDSSADTTAATTTTAGAETFVIGVSNNTVGNCWREQMICAMKAEARVRGNVSEVVLLNRETDTAGQISDITSLISQ